MTPHTFCHTCLSDALRAGEISYVLRQRLEGRATAEAMRRNLDALIGALWDCVPMEMWGAIRERAAIRSRGTLDVEAQRVEKKGQAIFEREALAAGEEPAEGEEKEPKSWHGGPMGDPREAM